MIDEKILIVVEEILKKRTFKETPENILILNEVIKQFSAEDGDLKKELEGIKKIHGQFVVLDGDFKWWVKLGDSNYNYAEGKSDHPSFTMHGAWKAMNDFITVKDYGVAALINTDIKFDGDPQDIVSFAEFHWRVIKKIEDSIKKRESFNRKNS